MRDGLNADEGALRGAIMHRPGEEPIVKKPQKKEVLVELAQGGDGLAGALRELEMRL